MIYLIYGNQTPSIKSRIKKIIKERLPEHDDMNLVRFDANNVLVQEWIDEANYIPLGYDHKIVIAEGCYFLAKTKQKNKIESDQNYAVLTEFLNHPSDECDLILTFPSLAISTTSDIYKLIKEKGVIVEIPDLDQNGWKDGVKRYCLENAKIKINNDALNELAERTAGDVALLQTSVAKLALYTDHITYEDVILMVNRPLEDNTFLIFNYLIQGKNEEAIKLFRDLRVTNVEPVTLISMLANQFRLLNQVMYLTKSGYPDEEIAKQLNIKTIRAQILKKNTYSVSEKAIHRTLSTLFDLDLQIKSGQVDRFYAFELFLINFKRK
ncbi:MAG: DNA polymerase III subunit delta [Bacilli bacterium]|nr:DNA polymerase III subunit delta [Bacilli bacterium]